VGNLLHLLRVDTVDVDDEALGVLLEELDDGEVVCLPRPLGSARQRERSSAGRPGIRSGPTGEAGGAALTGSAIYSYFPIIKNKKEKNAIGRNRFIHKLQRK